MFDKDFFCQRLAELKLSKGINSSKELAKSINISPGALSNLENKKSIPAIDTLISLALYFNVSIDYLVGIDNILDQSKSETTATNMNIDKGDGKVQIEVENLQNMIIEVKFKNILP